MVCVWCVIGETMPKVISNHLNKNNTKSQAKVDFNIADRARSPRQLDPNDWVPFQPPIPAVWNPRPRSPLYTWFGAPWFDGAGALIRVRPPGSYLPPDVFEHDIHAHAHHKHHDHHHKPLYHDHHYRPIPPQLPPLPFAPGLQGLQG